MNFAKVPKTAQFLLLCIAFCGLVAIVPEVLPALHGAPGYVWTPFNSQNFRVGDTYYYAPWLREVLAGHWPLPQPTAVGNGILSIESVRAAPFALGAIPGLLFGDFRWVLVADYWLSGALTAGFVYGIATAFGCSARRACLAGIAGYFFSGIWAAVPPSAAFMQLLGAPPGLGNWAHGISENIYYSTARLLRPQEYETTGDLFRFVNLSLSGPLLIGHFYAAVLLRRRIGPGRIIGLLVISCAIAFSYPSHPIAAYLMLIAFAADRLARRDWRGLAAFCGVGLATIVILLVCGYPGFLAAASQGSAMMNAVYFSDPVGLRPLSGALLLNAFVLNKYVISLPLVILSLRRSPVAVSGAVACGGVAVALSVVFLLDPMILWPRFFARGIDPVWWAVVAIGVIEAFGQLAAWATAHRPLGAVASLFAGAAVLCLVAAPLVGFTRFGLQNARNSAHFIPAEQWQAYVWITRHLPRNAEVAALDWNDVDLLPVFTDVNLVFGHTDLAGTTSEEQLRRYMAVWRYVGLPREEMRRRIVDSVSASRRRVSRKLTETPFLSQPDYQASQVAEALVYWPSLGTVNGMPFADHGANPSVDPAFVAAALARYDGMSATTLPADTRCEYLLVSDLDRANVRLPPESVLIFENARRALYRIRPPP